MRYFGKGLRKEAMCIDREASLYYCMCVRNAGGRGEVNGQRTGEGSDVDRA